MSALVAAARRAAAIRPHQTYLWVGLIVLAGLSLRIWWVLHVDPFQFSDPRWYYDVASNVAEGKGFAANHHNVFLEQPDVPKVTAYRPPAYPLALAAVWKVVGVGEVSARIFNAVLDSITIVFVYAIGRRMFERRVGLAAAATFAIWPTTIIWLPMTLSEAMFTLLFTAAVWLLLDSSRGEAVRALAATGASVGVLTGIATLTRGEGILVLPIALTLWLARDGLRAALPRAGVAALTAVLVIMPWTVRNWVVMDSPVLISTNAGLNLRMGHAPGANGTFIWLVDPVDGVQAWEMNERPDWEVRGNDAYTGRALRYALSHPRDELRLAMRKVYYTYRSERELLPGLTYLAPPIEPEALRRSLGPIIDVSWYTLLFAAIATAPFWFRRQPERWLPAAVFVFWTLFCVLFFGLARYHLPLVPLLSVCAAGGLWSAARAAGERWSAFMATGRS